MKNYTITENGNVYDVVLEEAHPPAHRRPQHPKQLLRQRRKQQHPRQPAVQAASK